MAGGTPEVHEATLGEDDHLVAVLEALGVKLTVLSDEQAEYLDMDPSGPFKPENYRY
jgi:S-adenosylhomocysteine hydrolase